MPKLTIDGVDVEVPMGKRLVNAIEVDGKVDQLHNCGGHAACTSCRVLFVAGEPTQITQAEKIFWPRGLNTTKGMRLSCQILCDQDMEIKIISRLAGSGRRIRASHRLSSRTCAGVDDAVKLAFSTNAYTRFRLSYALRESRQRGLAAWRFWRMCRMPIQNRWGLLRSTKLSQAWMVWS